MSSLTTFTYQNQLSDLALNGVSAYSINQGRVQINIDQIINNRSGGNISGTLSVELWALPQAYQGQGFNGVALAATQIGELLDQHYLSQCQYDLLFGEPPAGSWTLCLMLREWDGSGYVTRDYINFNVPYIVEAVASSRPNVRLVRDDTNNVINVAFTDAASENQKTDKPAAKVANPVANPSSPSVKFTAFENPVIIKMIKMI